MIGARIPGPSESSAILAGATALAKGIIEKTAKGQIRMSLDVFSTENHKLLQSVVTEGSDPFDVAAKLALALRPDAKPVGANSPRTFELWSNVLNGAGSAPQLKENCQKLLEADPDFSPGYSTCLTVVASMYTKPEVRAVGEQVYNNRDKLTLEAQNVGGQLLFQTGNFEHASELLRRASVSFPASWNQVGYAEAMLGHADQARKAIEDYRKLGGDEANAVDSLGEVLFLLRNYQEAEKQFLECGERFPQTVQGRLSKMKAASMRALRGDRAGAEELARSFLDPLRKAGQDVKQLEEAWRQIILEQDPAVMKQKIERSIITIPGRDSNN